MVNYIVRGSSDNTYWENLFWERMDDDPTYTKFVNFDKYPLVDNYTKYYDQAINYGLRHKRLSPMSYLIVEDILDALDEVEPYDEELILFRGVKSTPTFPVNELSVGDEIRDPGFASKSGIFEVAWNFTDDNCCILVFLYPPGSKHINLTSISHFPEEDEYITYPGERFEVQEIFLVNLGIIYKRVLVLKPIGYMYNMLSLTNMVSSKVEEGVEEFLTKIRLPVYMEDENTLLTDTNIRLPNVKVKRLYENEIRDKLYTLYVTGRAKNMYYVDLSKVPVKNWEDVITDPFSDVRVKVA